MKLDMRHVSMYGIVHVHTYMSLIASVCVCVRVGKETTLQIEMAMWTRLVLYICHRGTAYRKEGGWVERLLYNHAILQLYNEIKAKTCNPLKLFSFLFLIAWTIYIVHSYEFF